jgi:hypothetical protein
MYMSDKNGLLRFAFARVPTNRKSKNAVESLPANCRGVAQPGSAPALGAGGPRFKSARPDHIQQSRLLLMLKALAPKLYTAIIYAGYSNPPITICEPCG